jgi:hypothetical protein
MRIYTWGFVINGEDLLEDSYPHLFQARRKFSKMNLRSCMIAALALIACETTASPIDESSLRERVPSNICDGIKDVVDVLKINKATALCSSYLKIPTVTSTVLETVTSPSTALATTTSTRYE